MSGWTVTGSQTGYSPTINTTNYKTGNSSIKLTPPSSYGYVRMVKTVNWDMSAPDERGNFRFWVYVHGTGEPTDFSVTLSNNQQYSNYFTTYYNAPYKFRYRPGWNLVNLRASDWRVGAGSPSWTNPIVSIRIMVYGTSATSYSIDGLASGANGIPAVLLTFDDGHNTLWNQAYDYMEPKNVRGTVYIITNQVDTIDRVTWPQLQDIYATGWTIGNHTAAHTTLTTLPLSAQEAALAAARDALNAHGLMNVDYVAYPYGNYNADTLTAMANLGMRSSRTLLNFNNLSPLTNPYEIAQKSVGRATTWETTKGYIDTAVSRGEILVLTLHDISANPTSSGMYIDPFQDMVDYIIAQGVPIITMDDLYRLQSSDITIPQAVNGSCWYAEAPNEFTLSYTTGEGGTLTGETTQVVAFGTDGTPVTAVPNTGYHFVKWSDELTANPRTDLDVTSNLSVTAVFAQDTVTLTVIQPTGGTITADPAGPYTYGAVVTLTATTDTGYTFSGWSGDLNGTTNPTTITLYGNKTVGATFTINTFTLTYSAGAGGSITGVSPQTVAYGEDGTLVTAVPNTGFHFVDWSDGVLTAARTDLDITASLSVTANFAPDTFTLTYSAGAGGSITGVSPQTVAYGEDGTLVTAVPNTGFHFVDWSDGVLTAARTDLDITANLSVTANFAPDTFTLTYTAGAGGSITGVSPQTVAYGEDGTLVTAVPNTGLHFVDWSDGVLTAARTDLDIMANLSVTANFAPDTFTLTYSAGVGGSITGVSPQTVAYGEDGTLVTAVPNTGFHFVDWSDGVLTAARTDLDIMANLSVTANFAPDTFTLTYSAGAGGSINGVSPQTVAYGEDGTLVTAVPNTGFHFVDWSDGVLTAARTDLDITANLSVTANFAPDTFTLTYSAGAGGSITGVSPQTVAYGEDGTPVTAVPNTGYHFVSWSDESTANPRTDLDITANLSVTANFAINTYTLTVNQPTGGTIAPITAIYDYGTLVNLTATAATATTLSAGSWRMHGSISVLGNDGWPTKSSAPSSQSTPSP